MFLRILTRLPALPPALALAVALSAGMGAARAEILGSAASSASSAGSASIGSLSDSVQGSSNSSTGGDKVADGEYRITEIAALEGDRWQIRLKPAQAGADTATDNTAEGALTLRVPGPVLADAAITLGDRVRVRNQAYGLEFARTTAAGRTAPFFLALNDAALRGLRSQPL